MQGGKLSSSPHSPFSLSLLSLSRDSSPCPLSVSPLSLSLSLSLSSHLLATEITSVTRQLRGELPSLPFSICFSRPPLILLLPSLLSLFYLLESVISLLSRDGFISLLSISLAQSKDRDLYLHFSAIPREYKKKGERREEKREECKRKLFYLFCRFDPRFDRSRLTRSIGGERKCINR